MSSNQENKTMDTPNYIQRDYVQSNKQSWLKRLTVYVTSFALLYQPLVPAISSVLTDAYIQDRLNSFANFEVSSSSQYQFESPDYIESSAPNALDLDTFYKALETGYPHALGEPTYVPINSAGVNTVIPVYKTPKLVGTPLVQSRYVRSQVQALLGRSLIDVGNPNYETEAAQLNTLYTNGLNYTLMRPGLVYGDRLGLDQENTGLVQDMIWPETRRINGEDVVVPVVYLSNTTIANQSVNGNVTEILGNVSLDALTIDQVNIQFGRNTFLNVANDLLNNQGNINGEGELQIIAGGGLTNLSGLIQSTGDLRIAAHSINNQTLVHRYHIDGYRTEEGTRFGSIAGINSSDGSVTLRSYSDIAFQGAQVFAGGSLTLAADGSIYLGSQQVQSSTGGYKYTGSSVSYLQSSLSAEETLQLIANGEIIIDAAELVSDQGHIDILAGLGITIEDDLNQTQFVRKFRRGQESLYKTVAMRALLDAGKGIRLHSEFGDITMRAADITSVEGMNVKASNGGVNLLMTVENDHYSYNRVKKGMFTTKVINKGHEIETGVPNSIVGGLMVETANGLTIEYEGDRNYTLDEQIAELAKFEGLEWMADVRANTAYDVDWHAIELKYETWNESSTSLSPAFAAVVAIVIAVATAGAGTAAATSILGASASTAAAGSATAIAASAIAAGTTALISTAAMTAINTKLNGGSIGDALDELASSDTFKSIAIAMVTAGAMHAVNAEFFNITSDGVNPDSILVQETTQIVNDVVVPTGQYSLSFLGQATQALTQATVSAGIANLVHGGNSDEFQDAFYQSLGQHAINHLGKHMANKIKGAFDDPGADSLDTALKYISHAGAGCILGAASAANNDTDEEEGCTAGAGGAVVGELIGDIYESNSEALQTSEKIEGFLEKYGLRDPSQLSDAQKEELLALVGSSQHLTDAASELADLRMEGVQVAKLGAALAAFVAGGTAAQVDIAASTGENAAENNALFLVPIAIILLKAADIAITIYELNELRKDLEAIGDGDDQASREARRDVISEYFQGKVEEALLEAVVQKALTKLIPGATLLTKIVETVKDQGIISGSNVKAVQSSLTRKKQEDIWLNAPNTVPLRQKLEELSPEELEIIKSWDTFITKGVTKSDAKDFIKNHEVGKEMIELARISDASASNEDIHNRVLEIVQSGVDTPVRREITTPLVKIVAESRTGTGPGPYFTTPEQLQKAIDSGRPLSDVFGLPALNDAASYRVFQIEPKGTAVVFESTIAPTEELGGKLSTIGGAQQFIVPNRSMFNDPVQIDLISDN
jgi:adhesin HecA-like repeat protein